MAADIYFTHYIRFRIRLDLQLAGTPITLALLMLCWNLLKQEPCWNSLDSSFRSFLLLLLGSYLAHKLDKKTWNTFEWIIEWNTENYCKS